MLRCPTFPQKKFVFEVGEWKLQVESEEGDIGGWLVFDCKLLGCSWLKAGECSLFDRLCAGLVGVGCNVSPADQPQRVTLLLIDHRSRDRALCWPLASLQMAPANEPELQLCHGPPQPGWGGDPQGAGGSLTAG